MKNVTAIKKWIGNNWGFIIPISYILVVLVYVIFNQENIYVQVHDLLDDKIPVYKMLHDGKLWFTNKPMPYLHSEYFFFVHCASFLKLQSLFYILFPTFIAFILLEITKVILSIFGGVLLYKVCDKENFIHYKNIIICVSFMYGILPLQPMEAIGFASLPLLLALLISIYKTENPKLLLLAFLYPTLSSFSFFGIFICGYIFLFFIIDTIAHVMPKRNLD